jgi:hypothetical protein
MYLYRLGDACGGLLAFTDLLVVYLDSFSHYACNGGTSFCYPLNQYDFITCQIAHKDAPSYTSYMIHTLENMNPTDLKKMLHLHLRKYYKLLQVKSPLGGEKSNYIFSLQSCILREFSGGWGRMEMLASDPRPALSA